jgi:hypothetical protein
MMVWKELCYALSFKKGNQHYPFLFFTATIIGLKPNQGVDLGCGLGAGLIYHASSGFKQ